MNGPDNKDRRLVLTETLDLPERTSRPSNPGITMVMDRGPTPAVFEDLRRAGRDESDGRRA